MILDTDVRSHNSPAALEERWSLLKLRAAGQARRWEAALDRHTVSLRKGASLATEYEPCAVLACVLSGWLQMSKSLDGGDVQILDLVLPGELAEPLSADGQTAFVTVQAVTKARVALFSLETWSGLLEDLPELAERVETGRTAARVRLAERMLRIGRGSAEVRVAHALLEFSVRLYGAARDTYHVPLTQQVLGDFLGLSSVHVCRVLKRLSDQDLVETGDHMDIHVINPGALSLLAGVDRRRFARVQALTG
ncbi:Crp/Fnr family transcriptional regulator [Primorskyibacter sp. 2E107]|uniref:Crp/Fnr family transcriptional regulator n=1 Tax=Primorskyibacter sp. 2E107 TaxID=3403458 RepID=UPI003AF6C886